MTNDELSEPKYAATLLVITYILNIVLSTMVGYYLYNLHPKFWVGCLLIAWYINAWYGSWLRGVIYVFNILNRRFSMAVMNGQAPEVEKAKDLIGYSCD